MFVRRKEASPEDKLLEVIERSGSASAKARFSLERDSTGKKANPLDLINLFISVVAVLATIAFIFILNKPEGEFSLDEERPLLTLRGKGEKDLAGYANIIMERNPFQIESKVEEEDDSSFQENIEMKLVGILLSDGGKSQAFIEAEGKTHTCSEGDVLPGNIKVERINEDHVVLDRGGTKIELR